ncbi:serine hydrolase domain-containing protein [Naasia lichenicola]|nr:serine hydrolase domain-containing protein [Naasia lichenicola]
MTFPQLPTASVPRSTAAELDAVLTSSVEHGFPAVMAAVIEADGLWSGAAGADGPEGRPAAVHDEFAMGGITRLFTAALVMRLAERGELQLDDPLSSYLPDDIDSNGATVLQALQMRSGLPDGSPSSGAKPTADPSRPWTRAELTAEFPEPAVPAGREYIHSDPTYTMLGLAVETVTGLPLAEAIRTSLLDPAGSSSSLLLQGTATPTPRPWALPISGTDEPIATFGAGAALPNLAEATSSPGASGMAGTAPDLAEWAWQLFAGKIVSLSSVDRLIALDDAGTGSGLDDLTDHGLPGAYGHIGSMDGYQSLLAVFPGDQTVIVVFATQRDAAVEAVAADLEDALGP